MKIYQKLIEKASRRCDFWLALVQMRIVQVSEAQFPYAKEVAEKMRSLGIRAEADTRGERLPKQIRKADKEKIPVMEKLRRQI